MKNSINVDGREFYYQVTGYWAGGYDDRYFVKYTIFYQETEKVKSWSWGNLKFIEEDSPKVLFEIDIDVLNPKYSKSDIKKKIDERYILFLKKEIKELELIRRKEEIERGEII